MKDLATSSFAKAAEDIKNAKKAWPTARLGDVCEIVYGTRVRKKDSIGDEYPVYGGGGETFRWDTFNRENQCVVSRFAMSEECVRFVKGKFFLNDSGLTVDSRDVRLLQSFLDWFLFGNQEVIYFFGKGSAQRNLDIGEFSSISIPLPPLTVQCEIVARLEKELGEADRLAAKFKRVAELADDAFKAELDETFMAVEGEKVRLGDVCVIQRGGSPRPIKKYLTTSTNGLNWIKIGDVASDGKYIVSVEDKITPSGLNKTRRVKAGDFLLSNSMSFGRPYILKIDGCIHDGWLVLHGFQDKFSEDYFYYLLRSSSVQIQFDSLAHGSSVRNLNTSAVSSVEVSITSLPEQRTIVAKLDAAKERCEKLKAAAMRGLAAAENLRKAILAEAFE